jgi:hypothetical protein
MLISVPLTLTNRVYRSGVRVADVMLSLPRSSATAIVNHTTTPSAPLLLRLIRARRTNLTILTTRVQDSFVEGFRLRGGSVCGAVGEGSTGWHIVVIVRYHQSNAGAPKATD